MTAMDPVGIILVGLGVAFIIMRNLSARFYVWTREIMWGLRVESVNRKVFAYANLILGILIAAVGLVRVLRS